MTRRILLLLMLVSPVIAQGQTTTTTGTIVDGNGNPYSNGTASAQKAVASGQVQPPPVNVTTNGSGTFSMTLPSPASYIFTICAPPTQIGPTGNPTPTSVCFNNTAPVAISGASQDVSSSLNAVAATLGPNITGVSGVVSNGTAGQLAIYAVNGKTVSGTTAVPYSFLTGFPSACPANQVNVQVGLTLGCANLTTSYLPLSGTWAFAGTFSGNSNHAGSETFTKINNVVYLDGTVNTTLATCYAAIPSSGGACIVPPNYTETMAASLTMGKANAGFIFMGPATITMGSNQVIVTAGTHGVFFKGTVPFGGGAIGLGAQFTYSGNGKAFQVGGSSVTTRMFAWDNVTVVLSGAGTSASGLYMTNVVYFRLINPSVVGDGTTTGTVGVVCDGTGNFCGTGEIIGPYMTGLGTGILGNGPGGTGANAIVVLGGTVQSTVVGGIGIDLENADSSSVYGLDIESESVAIKFGALAAGNFIRIRQEANTTDVQALAGSQFNVVQVERANVPVVSDAGTNNQFYRMQDGKFLNIFTPLIQASGVGGINFTDSLANPQFFYDSNGAQFIKNWRLRETTVPIASAALDTCYGDSTLHQPKCDFSGSGFFPMPQTGNTAGTHSDSGFYQTATAAGCTTAASIGGVCASSFTVTWPVAFADTNYKMSCSPNGAATNLPSAPYVVTKSAGSVTMNYFAISAAAASWPNVECTAVHN